MKQKIKYGVGTQSDKGQIFEVDPENLPDEFKDDIFARDDNTCTFCDFKSEKYQNTLFIGEDAKSNNKSDYVTACSFCHQCFHIEKLSYMQSGTLIWLPEIPQTVLNNICRAIYIARITQGPVADSARDALDLLMSRKAEARSRLATDDPKVLATIFQDFMEGKEYANRNKRLNGFRILPLDRRLVREGELEFNQFPQMLAYWRSSKGPFGATPPRSWTELFYNLSETITGEPKIETSDVPHDITPE